MIAHIQSNTTTTLTNGVTMPVIGLGVLKSREGGEVEQAVETALEVGYRSIDTASAYRNEAGVGRALRNSSLDRESMFITSKVWNSDQGYDATLRAFDQSLERLKLDYLDLYLIHWPVAGKFVETWRALETLYREGRVRAIGLSNFLDPHLDLLLPQAEIKPMVNQIEFHPWLQQPELIERHQREGIQLEAWRPIMMGQVQQIPTLIEIGQRHGKSPVQVTLRWQIQRGIVTIPKSTNLQRIAENFDLFDFELSPEEMARIDALDQGRRLGPDPLNFNF